MMNFYRIRMQIERDSCEIRHLLHHSICSLCRGLQIQPIPSTELDSPNDYLFQESFGRYVWARMFFEPLTQESLDGLTQTEMARIQQELIKHFAGKPIIKAFVFFPSLGKVSSEIFQNFSSDWLFIEYGFFEAPKTRNSMLEKSAGYGSHLTQLNRQRLLSIPDVPPIHHKEKEPSTRISREELQELLDISFALNRS